MITETLAGTELGPYRIVELVGRGGMGVVYLAEHVGLRRRVALKLLAPELAESESFRERFVRESRLAASIDHPNVIPIYDATEIDGAYFIAMRYVQGMDLKELLRSESLHILDMGRTVSIIGQVASALDAAHAAGLVHRDVKPGNILVSGDSDHCYLTDFGLTKATSAATGFTATGQFVGTTDYCAPEQIQGRAVDGRTDVYSLGCVVYECLTGSPPFARENDLAVMYAHMQDPPPKVSAVRRDVPSSLDQVIATAMAKQKDHRYPSCSALAGALRAALEIGTGRSLPHTAPAGRDDDESTIAPLVVPSASYTQPETEGPPVLHTPVEAYPPVGGYPPPAVPPATPPGSPEPKRGWLTAAALIIAALLVAGGGTAAALIISGKKSSDSGRPVTAAPGTNQTPPTSSAPTTAPPNTTPPSAPAGGGDTGAEQSAAEQVVNAHWTALKNHDYPAAYSYWTSPYTDRNPASSWISDHKADHTDRIDFQVGSASVSGDTGSVHLDFAKTHSQRGGYKCFAGDYAMRKVSGAWKMADSYVTLSC